MLEAQCKTKITFCDKTTTQFAGSWHNKLHVATMPLEGTKIQIKKAQSISGGGMGRRRTETCHTGHTQVQPAITWSNLMGYNSSSLRLCSDSAIALGNPGMISNVNGMAWQSCPFLSLHPALEHPSPQTYMEVMRDIVPGKPTYSSAPSVLLRNHPCVTEMGREFNHAHNWLASHHDQNQWRIHQHL